MSTGIATGTGTTTDTITGKDTGSGTSKSTVTDTRTSTTASKGRRTGLGTGEATNKLRCNPTDLNHRGILERKRQYMEHDVAGSAHDYNIVIPNKGHMARTFLLQMRDSLPKACLRVERVYKVCDIPVRSDRIV
jgi:hypothetical protein